MHSQQRQYPLVQFPYFFPLSFWSLTHLPQQPHSYPVQLLLSLVQPQCGLSVSSQGGSAAGDGHEGRDALDQEGGGGQ